MPTTQTVNSPLRRAVVLVLLAVTSAATATFADTAPFASAQVPQDVSVPGIVDIDNQRAPLYDDAASLQLGRDLYAKLQVARSAAVHRESALLRVALEEARHDLSTLQLPFEQAALISQMQIIRHDLKDSAKLPDTDLWVPLEMDVDIALQDEPVEAHERAHAAVQAGKIATTQNERSRAGEQLDELATLLRYSLGVFPLHSMSLELDAAWQAAHQDSPDWAAALKALNTAMASIHWYAHVPVSGLAGAYNDVANAWHVVSEMPESAAQRRRAHDFLQRAANKLSDVKEVGPEATEITDLIGKSAPDAAALQRLMSDLRSKIEIERLRAQDRYWKMVGEEGAP